MTQNEFIEVTAEMEKYFEKELKIEQSRVWFEELKDLTKERYKQIAHEAYKTLKFMPKLADIIDLNSKVTSTSKTDDTVYEECSRCNGTGIVIYQQYNSELKKNYTYGARCTCKNGLKVSSKIPSIQELGLTM